MMRQKPESHGFELIQHVPMFCSDIAIRGSYAYLTNGWNGFSILDISNISSPSLIGKLHSSLYTWSLTFHENIVCIAEHPDEEISKPFSRPAGIQFIDVSNPATPIEIHHYPAGDFVDDVVIDNHYLFALANYYPEPFTCTLLIVEVRDPRNPVLVGKLPISGRGHQLVVSEHQAYIAAFDGLHVIDVSHVKSPREIYHIGNNLSLDGAGIDSDSQNLYVASRFQGLRIFAKQTEAPPTSISRTFLWGMADSIAVSGNTVYISDTFYGLWRFDLSNPGKPRETGFFSMENTGNRRLAVAHSHIFVAADPGGLFVLRDTQGQRDLNINRNPGYIVPFED